MVMLFDSRSNFKKFSFRPSSTFNIRKGHKISGRKALNFKRYQPKTSLEGGGGVEKRPPSPTAFRVNSRNKKSRIGNDSQLQMFTLYRMGFRSSLEIYPIQCETMLAEIEVDYTRPVHIGSILLKSNLASSPRE